ncbi:hypothetical protein EOM89_11180 [Candidatus Falkowbacteria bacterium]|nr:hypothetical protein [Candidatus Falkowbacteria bacterium]
MVDLTEEHRDGAAEPRTGPERVLTLTIDAVAAAHLRVLAAREGVSPEVLAGRLVSQRLHAVLNGLLEGGG